MASSAVTAQQPAKAVRIGILETSSPDTDRLRLWGAFRRQLRQLGYVEGQNITIEFRWGQGHSEGLPALAAELVVNLKTAMALGMTIPPSVLIRADQVIQ